MAGCEPETLDIAGTLTARAPTAEAQKTIAAQTRAAEPTYTPRPTNTPDIRSPFEKCADSGTGVRYVITGDSVTAVSLTWQNDTGGTDQGEYKLPFCMSYHDFGSSDFLYISAQITQPTSGAGSVKCRIYDGDSIIAEANAGGFASIATCSGSAK